MDTGAQGIYVVTTDDGWPSKVGISGDLYLRMTQLQNGNWHRLRPTFFSFTTPIKYGRKNFYSMFDGSARTLESLVHRTMKELDIHLSGEWYDCTSDAAEAVIKKVSAIEGFCLHGVEPLKSIALYDRLPVAQVDFARYILFAQESAINALYNRADSV